MYIRNVCAVQMMFCNKIYLLVAWIFINATFKEVIPTPILCHPHTSQSLVLTQPETFICSLAVKGGTEINLNLSHLKEFHSLRNEISSIASPDTWLQVGHSLKKSKPKVNVLTALWSVEIAMIVHSGS